MSNWFPVWSVTIGGVDYTDITLANLSITSGRTDFYVQPAAGYCSVEIINLDENVTIAADLNDQMAIQVKDSTGTFVPIFGGFVTDISQTVKSAGSVMITQSIKIIAMGALAKLAKILVDGVLPKELDGEQIYDILEPLLFNTWSEVPAALTWATYDPTTDWLNAENSGIGEIDTGDYELAARSSSRATALNIVSGLATSGLGYLYEDGQGRICYADSTHRSQYLAANGYSDLSANDALANGISVARRTGDLRNSVTVKYDATSSSEQSASDATSIATYGQQGYLVTTTLHNSADALSQANFYLELRAYPSDIFKTLTYELTNPEVSDTDRDDLLGIFMGLPVNITDLPANMIGGTFQGFVEGWTFSTSYNRLTLTINLSPVAYSLQAMRWENVPVTETWLTISPTLDWENATIVA
ncbi:hypothetical protein UFOVP794_2 [uncultured Caudovirales phage]|uniref:Uncharacterized protein n=1 Tax=uncultured Caudovirales phage TaxID=2100421 RepID=A0A6J5NR55_9CAUD|nr:hypothetical protein UFOVP794_2 [uncultured Caudovirales phage]